MWPVRALQDRMWLLPVCSLSPCADPDVWTVTVTSCWPPHTDTGPADTGRELWRGRHCPMYRMQDRPPGIVIHDVMAEANADMTLISGYQARL